MRPIDLLRSTRATLRLVVMLLAATMALSGCFLRSLAGMMDEGGHVSFGTNVSVSHCDSSLGCIYSLRDENGDLWDLTSQLRLSGLGLVGVIIDPLILQVPADAANVVATYNVAGVDEPLVVSETTTFPVTPGTRVDAEAGTKFLIVELPDAVAAALPVAGADFDFALEFDVGDPSSLAVKPMLTGSVDHGGVRYYLPIFPCVTDFALVPAVQVPGGTSPQDLLPQARALAASGSGLVCNQVTYDFSSAATTTTAPATTSSSPVPATTQPTTPVATAPAVPTTLGTVLPVTGGDTAAQVWIAALLLLSGGGLAVVGVRRRPQTPQLDR